MKKGIATPGGTQFGGYQTEDPEGSQIQHQVDHLHDRFVDRFKKLDHRLSFSTKRGQHSAEYQRKDN